MIASRTAATRWLARHGPGLADLRPVSPGADLFAGLPIVAAIGAAGGSLGPRRGPSLTCKPSSHRTVSEYPHGVKPKEHRKATVQPGKRSGTDSFVTDLAVSAANVAELAEIDAAIRPP